MTQPQNRRILLIDDTPSIHEDFRKILAPPKPAVADLRKVETSLFGEPVQPERNGFQLDSALNGRDGVDKVACALESGQPYAMAFVDMRMPPGWDGVETIERLWRIDPHVQIVICTAYSDHPWETVMARLDVRDRLLVVKKPFDPIEVSQFARTLTAKWEVTRQAALQIESLARAVQELRASEAALRQSQKEQQTFVHSLSHDLRAPLTAMNAFSQLLMRELSDSAEGKALHFLSRIRANAGVAEQLIDDLLFLEGVSRAEVSTQPVELGMLARELLDGLRSIEPQRQAEVTVHEGLWAEADPALARVLLRHLLVNAWKFSSGRPVTRIEVGRLAGDDDQTAFFVRDDGPGFDMAYADKLFHRPQRLVRGSDLTGTGVGLVVVSRIAGRHGGRAWCESAANAGATFYFTLAASDTSAPLRRSPQPDAHPG
jgi:two-component system, NtrC family, sensor kinase